VLEQLSSEWLREAMHDFVPYAYMHPLLISGLAAASSTSNWGDVLRLVLLGHELGQRTSRIEAGDLAETFLGLDQPRLAISHIRSDERRRFLVEYPPAGETAGIPPFFAVRAGSAAEPIRVLYGETLSFSGARVTDRELYDLVQDPFERRSLHQDPSPARIAQRRLLSRQLQQLKTCGNGTCQALEDEADP